MAFDFIRHVIPDGTWMKYATYRLGTFILTYTAVVAFLIITFALGGIVLSFDAVFGIAPLAIFIAIRVSGALVREKDT